MNKQEEIKVIEQQIEELNKKKEELLKQKDYELSVNDKYIMVTSKYNNFSSLVDKFYFEQKQTIFQALANFSAHNDPEEMDRPWDGKTGHYRIEYCPRIKSFGYDCDDDVKSVTEIYFSSAEKALLAIQMLKDEGLIERV